MIGSNLAEGMLRFRIYKSNRDQVVTISDPGDEERTRDEDEVEKKGRRTLALA